MHNYFNREIFIIDPDNAFTEFCGLFNSWEASRGLMFARMAYAYSLGYNPIENYSSIEKYSGHDDFEHGEIISRQAGTTHTTTHTQDKVTTTYTDLTDTTKNKRYGVNSSTAQNTDESENTRTGSQADEHTGSVSVAGSGSDTDRHTGKDITTYGHQIEKSGNIGVMTASQMLQSQYDGLNQDLADRAIKDFLQKYTFYSGEVDYDD